MGAFFGLLGIVAVVGLFIVFVYNSIIALKNRTQSAWSDIDVQLKRRYNLIPNLVETVKGYAKHEEGVFTKVTEARAKAINAEGAESQAQAENMLSGALKSLFAVAESYPDLKANQNFIKLQEELSALEEHIQSARRFYNGNVRDFNTKIEVFPNNIIANSFGFKKFEFFEIEDEKQRENVKVDFNATPPKESAAPVQEAPAEEKKDPEEKKEEIPAQKAPAEEKKNPEEKKEEAPAAEKKEEAAETETPKDADVEAAQEQPGSGQSPEPTEDATDAAPEDTKDAK